MARYFITGATGFIGRYLLRRLSSTKNDLYCLYRHDRPSLGGPYINWVKGDLLDGRTYRETLEGADTVVHLAGLLSARRKEEYLRINVEGTASLLKACQEVGSRLNRFVHMSSIAAVGPNQEGFLITENSPCSPQSEYGQSKYLAEHVVLSHATTLPVVILRPTFVYGREDVRGLDSLRSLGNPLSSVWMSRIGSVCLCHVTDVAEACVLSAEADLASGEVFIISDPQVSTWEFVLKTLEEVFHDLFGWGNILTDGLVRLRSQLAAPFDPRTRKSPASQFWACDTSKARKFLGFNPSMPFKEGAADTISWYISQGLLSEKDIRRMCMGHEGT